MHEFETPEDPPAVSHSCFCCVSVGTLIPVLVTLPASAMCPLPIADVLPTNTAASAAIATSTSRCFVVVYYTSHFVVHSSEAIIPLCYIYDASHQVLTI